MDTEHSAITEPARRPEVFTGAGRRRTWRHADKARIVAEITTSGESVCAVARRDLPLNLHPAVISSEHQNSDDGKHVERLTRALA
jgi:transposase-like protein